MPMRYADPADVFRMLNIETDPLKPKYDADVIERVVRIENGLADNFDAKVNTSFGVAPTAEVRTVWRSSVYGTWDFWYPESTFYDGYYPFRQNVASRDMTFPIPLRALTDIRTGGDWDGSTWIDDEIVPSDSYALIYGDGTKWWGIRNLRGDWAGVYRVQAVWMDQSQTAVPPDVREALTFLTCDQYRMLNTSPAGTLGPDGRQIYARNPWAFESVKAAIERHTVYELIV